ncbi:MAG: Kelch repeat-containing protein [Rudaea sp.]
MICSPPQLRLNKCRKADCCVLRRWQLRSDIRERGLHIIGARIMQVFYPTLLRAALILLAALGGGREAVAVDSFTFTGNLLVARHNANAVLLNNGKVLVAGGIETYQPTDSAELYDPATGTFTATGNMVTTSLAGRTATLLPNGKVLIAGGLIGTDEYSDSAEIYDPATGSFAATAHMIWGRGYATATLLPNGKVLIAAGIENYVGTAELYDPANGTFTSAGMMQSPRIGATATLLPNGQVLIEGGFASAAPSAELYDPQTGSFTTTGNPTIGRYLETATLLQNGQVLVAGGENFDGGLLSEADIYDPDTGTFTATGSLNTARLLATASLLPDGKVLIAGGADVNNPDNSVATAELYDPATGKFTAAASMNIERQEATATVLPGGRVLVAGGDNNDDAPIFFAEIYTANVVYRSGFDGP